MSEDSLALDRPRTHLRFWAGRILEWLSERYDHFNDSTPAKRFRFRLRRILEVRPRNGSDTDSDWDNFGTDPTIDNVTNAFDLQDPITADPDAIVDLGSQEVVEASANGSVDNSGFRRAFQASVRFGPNRLSRIIVSIIVTNVRNAINDSQITVPGGASFNIQLENFPFRSNDTTPVLEFDVDTDIDEGNLTKNMTGEMDDNQVQLQDDTEGRIDFDETRKIRWKRRVFCDGNKEVVVRIRFVKNTTETPDGGFLVRKKLIVTFHINSTTRCSKLFWDPTNDVETPPDQYIEPTTPPTDTTMTSGTPTDTTMTSGTPTGTTPNPTGTTPNPTGTASNPTGTTPVPSGSNDVIKLFDGLLLFVIALLI